MKIALLRESGVAKSFMIESDWMLHSCTRSTVRTAKILQKGRYTQRKYWVNTKELRILPKRFNTIGLVSRR